MKIQRKYMAHYLNAGFGGSRPTGFAALPLRRFPCPKAPP